MGKKDVRVDAYIAKSATFARPVLQRVRKLVHAGCPEASEAIKWGMPAFMYKGIFCMMAAFKEHCTFGFWHPLMRKAQKGAENAMGQFGRIRRLEDLPGDAEMSRLIKQAVGFHDAGVKPMRVRKPAKAIKVPAFFSAALTKNKKAKARFKEMSTSCRNEYVQWLTEAKRDETRAKRLATAMKWIAEGKSRNWKYEKC